MAPYLFWELIVLIVGVWLIAALFVVYGWLLLRRQRKMIQDFIALQGAAPTPQEEVPPLRLEISKEEPISKYKDLTPEEADVSFVDKDA